MVQKFFDFVRNFIKKVKNLFKGDKSKMDEAAQEEYGATVEQLERAEQLWRDALAESEKAVQEKKQSLESSAQQEYNGANEIQYSLYWKPDLNATEWSIVNSVMNRYHSNATWDADDITVGFHVKSKGEEVFGYYSTDDNTLLYAVGGKKAAAANTMREDVYRRFINNGSNETSRTLSGRSKALRAESGIGISDSYHAGNRRKSLEADGLSGSVSGKGRNSDQGRNHGRSEANHRSEVSSNDGLITNKNGEAVAQIHENGSAQFSLKTYK